MSSNTGIVTSDERSLRRRGPARGEVILGRPLRRSKQRLGFTIIEILIAIVVLVLGITGILALFPTAINSGNKTVEDSYSAAITQSVVDAIAVGLRESRYTYTDSNGRLWTYFIFDHDGVLDQAPGSPEDYSKLGTDGELWNKDYCILLPQPMLGAPADAAVGYIDRKDEPVFIYPVPNSDTGDPGADRNQRQPSNLAQPDSLVVDNFDLKYWNNTTTEETSALWVSRIYRLGRYRAISDPPLPTNMSVGDVRLEYRGEDLVNPSASGTGSNTIALDPYPTYGFSFAIKRARVDSNGDGMVSPGTDGDLPDTNPPADAFSDSLYELRIMVFKNFNPDVAKELGPTSSAATGSGVVMPKTNVPIKQFITLISI